MPGEGWLWPSDDYDDGDDGHSQHDDNDVNLLNYMLEASLVDKAD